LTVKRLASPTGITSASVPGIAFAHPLGGLQLFYLHVVTYYNHLAGRPSLPSPQLVPRACSQSPFPSWIQIKNNISIATALSLLYPFHGLLKAVTLLLQHCVFGTDELGNAALAVVTRTEEWNPPTKY